MTTTNPKGYSYFSKIVSKARGLTLRPEREINHEVEVEVVESISWVEALAEPDNIENVNVGPSKSSKKRDRSVRRSHSSSRCHRHAIGCSSRPLPNTIFVASTRFSDFFFILILMGLLNICSRHMIFLIWRIQLSNSQVALCFSARVSKKKVQMVFPLLSLRD